MKRNSKLYIILLLPLMLSLVLVAFIAHDTGEVIASATKSGDKLEVTVLLCKDTGEIDSEHEYYSIYITIEDMYSKNDTWVNPVFADVWVNLPSEAEELGSNHKPMAGYHSLQSNLTFSYIGVTYDVFRPGKWVVYTEFSNGPDHRCLHWHVSGVVGPLFKGWIFFGKAEFSVGIRVPQDFKPTAEVDAYCAWYRDLIFWKVFDSEEYVYDVYVESPGALSLPVFHP